MAVRKIHLIGGQSNCVGAASKGTLTDLRYDVVQNDVRTWTRLNGINSSTSSASMAIGVNAFGVEAGFSYRLRTEAGQLPMVFRFGGSGYALKTTFNPDADNEWAACIRHMWACLEAAKAEFPGDTFEFDSFTWIQGEADAQSHSFALDYFNELVSMVSGSVRREFAKRTRTIFVKLSPLCGVAQEVPGDLDIVRTAFDDAAATIGNAAIADADGIELQGDSVHYTANGLMSLADRVYEAWAGLPGIPVQLVKSARAFPDLVSAQAFASSAQTAVGNRSENPATGGFARRLGVDARDPWPATPRSQVLKHPHHPTWFVPIDPGMVGFGLDLTTNLRPVDLSWLVYA